MPNLAFQLEVLNQVVDQLQTTPNGKAMAKEKKYAALGALGPDLLRYRPISSDLSDALDKLCSQPGTGVILSLPFKQIKELFFKPLGAMYSILFRQVVVPTWPVLNELKAFLNSMDVAANSQNLLAIPSLIAQATSLKQQVTSLTGKLQPGFMPVIAQIIALPPFPEADPAALPLIKYLKSLSLDPALFERHHEFLRWHKTGNFATTLMTAATVSGNTKLRAFAGGYLSQVAASVTAEPFINNITGGFYRSHWQRNRLAGNFVDAWTYGFFKSKATMVNDEPHPPYASWPRLCSANLQEEFNVAGFTGGKGFDVPDALKAVASGQLGSLPNQFPQNLELLLQSAFLIAYGFDPRPPDLLPQSFKEALVGAYAVYWFMTSGSGPMCISPIGPPPPGCLSAPPWITSPSIPTPQQLGVNVGGATCAVALAILSLILFLLGAVVAGLIALIIALNQQIIDWDTVRCNLYWLKKTLYDAENAFCDLFVRFGFAYPRPSKLGTIDFNGVTHPANDFSPGSSGVPICKTNSNLGPGQYPKRIDFTLGAPELNFGSFPGNPPVENPATKNVIKDGLYPDWVVNGNAIGGIPSDPSTSIPTASTDFGDAVSNAIQLINQNGANLQNYNLDADRGYGWKV